ncbi:MAG: ABC transporter substrate-binding protein [Roseitalea porphyridii]|uniref:ABC transporter substrate-binding protein n=1 Tax=Roseitalea porphyridii TaxID=1852022 RepID=UPI0032D8CC4A
MRRIIGPAMACAACALLAVPAAAQETEVNWATFWVGTNPLKPWGEALLEGFNAEYDGQYEIVTEEIPGDKQYRDKMRADAVADALPDLITGNTALMKDLRDSGRVVDLMPYLEADPEWRDSFFDNAFDTYLTAEGELYALPYSRDYIGIFYNKAMFEEAGIEEFPRTWEAFFEACDTLSAAGFIPMATEGDWTTRLMWANMIGTQPGGAEWLSTAGGEGELELVGNAPVVAGTEMLRRMFEEGCTNEDAFTGQYATGATLFLQAEAAMIANGPWMIPNIKGVNTETAEGLGEDVDYAVSPGTGDERGLIIVTGEAGFAVGAKEQDKIDGSVAFLKYLTSDEQMLNQAVMVSRFGPTRMELSEEQRGQLEPMLLDIVAESEDVQHTYPHTNITMPTSIIQEFINSWPVYARGQIDTETFLEILEDAQ